MNKTLPEEVDYLKKYDHLNDFIKNYIDMSDKRVDLLIRFLDQNGGKSSKCAQEKEFTQLTEAEVEAIEYKWDEIFRDNE